MHTTPKYLASLFAPLGIAVALVLGSLVPLVPAHAETWQDCRDEWNSAPAQAYCTDVVFARVNTAEEAESLGTEVGHCLVGSGTCSITATVYTSDDSESTTWTPTTGDIYTAESDVSSIDICFSTSDSGATWTATVKVGCASDDVTSATATTDGLGETTEATSSD